jgi:hypothetical protein
MGSGYCCLNAAGSHASTVYNNQLITGGIFGSVSGVSANNIAACDVSNIITGTSNNGNTLPNTFKLEQNYPNPFNPSTKIKFTVRNSLLEGGMGGDLVQLTIYNALGKEVETLVNDKMNPGNYEVEWNASKYSSGVYFYTLKANNFSETKKMLLVK